MSTPARFKHDCDRCVPLGQYNGHDLYWCQQGNWGPTVIARFGDDGPEYTSGMAFVGSVPELTAAASRAHVAGLETNFKFAPTAPSRQYHQPR
jgi:hypothetical protein